MPFCFFFLLGLLHGTKQPQKIRPDDSQLMISLFLHVPIHDKKIFDSSFQVYIHIFMKDSVTQGDLTVIEEFDILHLSRTIFQVFHSSLSRQLLRYHRTTLLFSSLAE